MQVDRSSARATSRDGTTIAVVHAEEHCDTGRGCPRWHGGVRDRIDVSEDGGAHYQHLGAVAHTFFADFDVAISGDGSTIYVTTERCGGSIMIRAIRQ